MFLLHLLDNNRGDVHVCYVLVTILYHILRQKGVAAAEHEDAGGGGNAGAEYWPERRVRLVPVEEAAAALAAGGGGGVAGVPVGGGAEIGAVAVRAAHLCCLARGGWREEGR